MNSLNPETLGSLHTLRNRYNASSTRRKKKLLGQCSACFLKKPRQMLDYHETLLFLAAHPDDAPLLKLVEAELQRVADASIRMAKTAKGAKALRDSGLPGGVIESKFSLDLTDWLQQTYPGSVEIDWDDDSTREARDELLGAFVGLAEKDGLLSSRLSTEEWMRLVTPPPHDSQSILSWLIRSIRGFSDKLEVQDHLFDTLDLNLRWKISQPDMSRTLLRFPSHKVFYQKRELNRSFSIPGFIRKPLPSPVSLSPARTRKLIDIARTVLAIRDRETDPVTYANSGEVTLFELERGVSIAIFGMTPARRLPLESYFGYVVARNGVPVAYGGAWVFGHRAELGIHIFDTYRGGESAYLFTQVLRIYHQNFNVNRFRIDPFQFGDGNEDALRSGAFWFYHRLGFRPDDPRLCEIADEHWQRLQADRTQLTPPGVLRLFIRAPLVMNLTGHLAAMDDLPEPQRIGEALSITIAKRFDNDQEAAKRQALKCLQRLLKPGLLGTWPTQERAAYEYLSPLIAQLEGVESWSPHDRKRLLRIMRNKGTRKERDYHLTLQNHHQLIKALRNLVDSIDWTELPTRKI